MFLAMLHAIFPATPRRLRRILAAALALAAAGAHADKVPMSDDELAAVSGKGVTFAVHLALNAGLLTGQTIDSRISAGFDVNGVTTYAIAQNFGGILDFFPVTLDATQKTDGTSYISLGMPAFVGAQEFGVRALAVQTDVTAAITPASSLGSMLLNGSASMTGALNIWSK